MALFHMQRFTCLKEAGSADGEQESQNEILKRLHEKARAKERQILNQPIRRNGDQVKGGQPKRAPDHPPKVASDGTHKSVEKKGGTEGPTKKKAKEKRRLPPEVILKKLHAKAKKREKVTSNEDIDVKDAPLPGQGSAEPPNRPQKSASQSIQESSTSGNPSRREGSSAKGEDTELQSSKASKKKRKLEAGVAETIKRKKKTARDISEDVGIDGSGNDGHETVLSQNDSVELPRSKQEARKSEADASPDAAASQFLAEAASNSMGSSDGPIPIPALRTPSMREFREAARSAKKLKKKQQAVTPSTSTAAAINSERKTLDKSSSSPEQTLPKSKKAKKSASPSKTSGDKTSRTSEGSATSQKKVKGKAKRSKGSTDENDKIKAEEHATSSGGTKNENMKNTISRRVSSDEHSDEDEAEETPDEGIDLDDDAKSRPLLPKELLSMSREAELPSSSESDENETAAEDASRSSVGEENIESRRVASETQDDLEGVDREGDGVHAALSESMEVAEEDLEKGFAPLGEAQMKKKLKVSRVLPDWLAHPTLVEHDLKKHSIPVEEMTRLDSRLVKSLLEDGVTHLFPVQRHVIPVILDSLKPGLHAGDAGYRPCDLCVSAPTGSGKTLAFALPVVQALLGRVVPRIRALVVLPTRDLAQQVNRVFTSLCRGTELRPALIGGLKKFEQEQRMLVQTSKGETQCDIVVATPGRLVDHINKTQGFTLRHLRFLVIDEADRMMEHISQDWIAQVEQCAFPSDRQLPGATTVANCSKINMPLQKLLFSATLSQNPEKLIQLNLFQPRLITSVVTTARSRRNDPLDNEGSGKERGEFVGKFTTPVGLTEYYVQCTPGEKPLVLLHLIRKLDMRQILCFVNTVESTHRLYHLLQFVGGVEVAEFSSNQTAGQRRQVLKKFKTGKIQLLVCSDAMARGMDVENAKYVISYDMPPYIKTYIHRVGRTARAGKKGIAFSLLQQYEVPKLLKMLKHAGKTNIQKHQTNLREAEDLVESYEKALQKLPSVLRMEKLHNE